MIGAAIDQGDFDRGEWMLESVIPQISELTVAGFRGRMGKGNEVLGATRPSKSGAKTRLSFARAGVILCHLAQPSNHPNLNHHCLVA